MKCKYYQYFFCRYTLSFEKKDPGRYGEFCKIGNKLFGHRNLMFKCFLSPVDQQKCTKTIITSIHKSPLVYVADRSSIY